MPDQRRFSSAGSFRRNRSLGSRVTSAQAGFTLFTLIIGLAVGMIMITAVLPNARFETKRAKELDLLQKGQHIAAGIEQFRRTTNRYPISMDELVTGVTIGIRQFHFVRPSAAKDPMTNDEWRLVRPGDPLLLEFAEAWSTYTMQPIPQSLQALIGVSVALPGSGNTQPDQTGTPQGGGLGTPQQGTFSGVIGPFVGVVSTSKESSARLYFGLESYDKWLFIGSLPQTSSVPGLPIIPLQQGPGPNTQPTNTNPNRNNRPNGSGN